ncbi:MAG: glucose 1-dehydrogenase [Actinobacteria bacterium]|nr:glucose 1-dehydrogenase [Actinomycetota bacterium]
MSGSLVSKVAIVTGSSTGIGEAVARALSENGARVVVSSSKSEAEGNTVAQSLTEAIYVKADIAEEAGCRALVDAAQRQWGRLDILVNNAGTTQVIPHQDLESVTDEVFRRLFEVNVLGTWRMIRLAAPLLKESGDGVIVNVSSLAGIRPTGSSIPYAVSKAAVVHMTRLAAVALSPEVRVNAVAPGLVDTRWTAQWTKAREQWSRVAPLAPLRGLVTPTDVACVCMSLIGARQVTGEVIAVDGGMGLRSH